MAAFTVAAWVFSAIATLGGAQQGPSADNTPINFDIAAQPLISALDRYGDATGREVFYDAALAKDRTTRSVAGSFTPLQALSKLLEGTGLAARFLDDGSFALSAISDGIQPKPGPSPSAAQQEFYAQIQAKTLAAFCRHRQVQPGVSRVVALIWIGSRGEVVRVEQLSSTGDGHIDRGVDVALRSVRLETRPPADFAQPALVMMVPRTAGVTSGCDVAIGPMRAGRP